LTEASYVMDFSNLTTPSVGNKRANSVLNTEVDGLRTSTERITLLELNKAFTDLKYNIQSNPKFEIPDEKRIEKRHEYTLIEVMTNIDARALLLYMLTHECGENLCRIHGIESSGQIRLASTKIVIDVILWKRFHENEMHPIFLERQNKLIREHDMKKKKDSGQKVPITKKENREKEYDQDYLNRSYKNMQKTLVPHILAQYEIKKEYEGEIDELKIANDKLKSALEDERMTIKALEEALVRAQNELKAAARSASGQQGARTRFLHELSYNYIRIFTCTNVYCHFTLKK
jgi:hypothetical protein